LTLNESIKDLLYEEIHVCVISLLTTLSVSALKVFSNYGGSKSNGIENIDFTRGEAVINTESKRITPLDSRLKAIPIRLN
jgi:hypothetical protein